jgi:hypothetical protein
VDCWLVAIGALAGASRVDRVRLEIATRADLPEAFGKLGVAVGGRTGLNRRTKAEREWWCLRRYIFTLSAARQIEFPIQIEKSERPDFRCQFPTGRVGVEVTTATTKEDEDAMDRREMSGKPALVGAHGGRQVHGNPEVAWRRDVLEAVKSKSEDIGKYPAPLPEHVILVYSSGNPSSLIDDALWPSVFQGSCSMNAQIWKEADPRLRRVAVICNWCWLLSLEREAITPYRLCS